MDVLISRFSHSSFHTAIQICIALTFLKYASSSVIFWFKAFMFLNVIFRMVSNFLACHLEAVCNMMTNCFSHFISYLSLYTLVRLLSLFPMTCHAPCLFSLHRLLFALRSQIAFSFLIQLSNSSSSPSA